ncbi:MAG: cation diffusion facilitator family transporter [Desulfovibrio sp.]|nr:cation diffusion facilitator family transporter [Desulfovibrio sp.]
MKKNNGAEESAMTDRQREITERDLFRGGEIRQATWVGLLVNAILTTFKFWAGITGNSRAVIADGMHSLSDLLTDIMVIVAVRFWVAPPDELHNYGHKRLESLISLFIGVLLAVAGAGIIVDAAGRMDDRTNEHVGSMPALFAALCSVVAKELLYRWTIKKGVALKSDALVAKAWDHRSDALSSLPIVVAVAVAMWVPSLAVVDLLGAMLVAGFILYAAWGICISAIRVLMDSGAGEEIHARLAEYCGRIDGVKGIHALRTRYLGQGLHVDMHVGVDVDLTVGEGNDIAHTVEDALYTAEATAYIGVEVFNVLVHIDPWSPGERSAVR